MAFTVQVAFKVIGREHQPGDVVPAEALPPGFTKFALNKGWIVLTPVAPPAP